MYKCFNSLKDIYKDECNVRAAVPSKETAPDGSSKKGRDGAEEG